MFGVKDASVVLGSEGRSSYAAKRKERLLWSGCARFAVVTVLLGFRREAGLFSSVQT